MDKYKIIFTQKANKQLKKLSHTDKSSIIDKITQLNHPFPLQFNISTITGVKNFYRLKWKKVRVIFELDHPQKEIWIRKVDYRKNIYRHL